MKKENEEILVRTERSMICMICGVTLASREQAKDLQERIGLVDASQIVCIVFHRFGDFVLVGHQGR